MKVNLRLSRRKTERSMLRPADTESSVPMIFIVTFAHVSNRETFYRGSVVPILTVTFLAIPRIC